MLKEVNDVMRNLSVFPNLCLDNFFCCFVNGIVVGPNLLDRSLMCSGESCVERTSVCCPSV